MHHVVFVSVVGIGGGFIMPSGALRNATGMLICGLPGGITYVCLCLVKYKKMGKITEKKINRFLNLYLRGPGLIMVAFSLWISFMNGTLPFHPIIAALMGGFIFFNGVYYTDEVVGNFYVWEDRRRRASSDDE